MLFLKVISREVEYHHNGLKKLKSRMSSFYLNDQNCIAVFYVRINNLYLYYNNYRQMHNNNVLSVCRQISGENETK